MSAKSERPANRRIKLVGGGWRMSRFKNEGSSGGSLKSMRRSLRHELKKKSLTPAARRAIKERLAQLLAQKDGR